MESTLSFKGQKHNKFESLNYNTVNQYQKSMIKNWNYSSEKMQLHKLLLIFFHYYDVIYVDGINNY